MNRPTSSSAAAGVAASMGAFVLWGLLPLYWKQFGGVGAMEIVAHRIVWSVVFLACVIPFRGGYGRLAAALRTPGGAGLNLLTSALILFNWLIFIWAVLAGHILDSSLGYFLTPLVSVLLGRLFLHERLNRVQGAAIALAACGVGVLLADAGSLPWVSVSLAVTFGFYGLLKKQSAAGPVAGLAIETGLVAPFAAGYLLLLAWRGGGVLGHAGPSLHILAVSAGIVTAVPLLLFAAGARRLRLATLGFIQYVSPTLSFLVGTLVYQEPVQPSRLAAFVLIWIALAIYTADSLISRVGGRGADRRE